MKTLLISLIALAAAPALAATRIPVVLDCTPDAALGAPMRVEWDSLLEISRLKTVLEISDDGTQATYTEIKSRIYSGFHKKELLLTDRYQQPDSRNLLVLEKGDNSLAYDAVVLTIAKLDIPFTAGPPMPGEYPAKAVLTLVSHFRQNPGDDEVKTASRQVQLTCKYQVNY